MSLFIASLNSGSNGNCYYVGNEHEAVLIEVLVAARARLRRPAVGGLLALVHRRVVLQDGRAVERNG